MRLAHLADVHLGCRQYNRQTPNGINQREADVARVFERAIDGVIAEAPDIVLIAGDLFHSVRPTNPAILHAFSQLDRLTEGLRDTPVVIIAGNHDTPRSAETGTILKLFEAIEGVHVVSSEREELHFGELDLCIMCVPHAALLAGAAALTMPEKPSTHNVLALHGEIAGVLSRDVSVLEYGGVVLDASELNAESWNYVALGHYHVARSVAPNAWYSGSLDYVSTNPWGELVDEEKQGRPGEKGWLLVDLGERTTVDFRSVALERRVLDLRPIEGAGLGAAELDRLINDRLAEVNGGIRDQIVRQVVVEVPRPVMRDLDYRRIREIKSEALHYSLDVRRPSSERIVGVGAPGRRKTLAEIVEDYLRSRSLAADVNRDALLELSRSYMAEVERDQLEE